MIVDVAVVLGWACPFCDGRDECRHFVGWTEDGRTIQKWRPVDVVGAPARASVSEAIREDDRVVKTGVTARVYRR